MWLSPKEVQFKIIDGERVGFRKSSSDPVEQLKERIKYLEEQLVIERGINWYEFWKKRLTNS